MIQAYNLGAWAMLLKISTILTVCFLFEIILKAIKLGKFLKMILSIKLLEISHNQSMLMSITSKFLRILHW